jgi:hypothetical protein
MPGCLVFGGTLLVVSFDFIDSLPVRRGVRGLRYGPKLVPMILSHSALLNDHCSMIVGLFYRNKMSLPNLAAGQGQIGGWEFAKLSFPCWLLGASFMGLPASRRHSPRQAESSAS